MRDFRSYHLDKLKNTQEAKVYLEAALELYEEDGDRKAFYKALRDVAEAQGGLTKLSKTTQLNRQNLYKIFDSKNKPKLDTVGSILNGLGFKFTISTINSAKTSNSSISSLK